MMEAIEIDGKRLHTAIRYGVSQAILDAVAKASGRMMCEVVADEYGCTVSDKPLNIFTQSGDDRYSNADKMIIKGAQVLPHALINNVEVNLLGGQLIKENLATASSFSSLYFTDTNFELAIISSAAFTPENGFSCSSQVEAELLRVICKKAKFLYMMLDSSKIGKIKPYTFARAEDINVLITDNDFPEALKEKFKAMNIVVI